MLGIDGRKTGWMRRVPVPELTRQCLEAYLPQRHNQLERCGRLGEAALFVNWQGAPLQAAAVTA